MLSSSRDVLLKLSETTSPQKNCSHLIASHCKLFEPRNSDTSGAKMLYDWKTGYPWRNYFRGV